MVSSAMSIQDETSGLHSTALYTAGSGPSLDAGAQSLTGEGHVLKIRKPYTITKQRERWTEEEHQKFLEALKLHGRAWRKIAEHVGTKTAVQIRSHAQKFFSKVARESNGDDGSSTEPIEIPPPRPKRKPLHPYPRKLVLPLKKDNPSMQEQPAGSMSPNSCLSEQENQSPTSVLSAVVSDALGSSASNVLNCSPSPISCADVSNDDQLTVENDFEGPRDMPVSVKLELCTKVDAFVKEGSVEATSTRCLKLFGTTLLITDSTEPSSSFACKLQISSPNHVNSNPNLNSIPVKKPTPLPWCAIGSAISFDFCEAADSGRLSEVDDTDKNSGTESGSQSSKDDNRVPSLSNPNKRASSAKGFEPCKRCFLERDLQSSTVDGAEKEA